MIVAYTLMFTVMVAITGLAIDGTRWFITRANLQFAVAAGAAAGARQLDTKPGAIKRAKDAANAVAAANIAATGDGFTSAGVLDVRVFSSLAPDTATADDEEAKFIRVSGIASATPLFPFTPVSQMQASAVATD